MRHADLVPDFVLECAELLDRIEADLAVLEGDPEAADAIAGALRGVHTVKGTGSALGLADVEVAAQEAEELLCRLRDGDDTTPAATPAAVRAAVARLRGLLDALGPAAGCGAAGLWDGVPDLVAELSRRLGRRVAVETAGRVDLDRTALGAVRGPLTHLVRNALDHGIEPPEVRVAAGKESCGRLRLSARQDRDDVVLEVSDDGRGIDLDRVAEAAMARGLVRPDELDAMTPEQVRDMVLLPGLTTACAVTEVSGRGVGLDAVRTGVERVGGSVALTSLPGVGTTCVLRVPLR